MLTGLDNLHIAADADTLARAAADHCVHLARHSIEAGGRFTLALAGGNTPRALYQLLAGADYRAQTDWRHWHVYFGDERCVPPDHADSNYRLARETLLAHVPIPGAQVHPMVPTAGAADQPAQAAADYEALIRRKVDHENAIPCFDLILLGLGADGHTASLFPGTEILTNTRQLVAAVHLPRTDTWRISFTYPLLNHARHLSFLVAGAEKAGILGTLQRGDASTPYPVQGLAPQGTVSWFVDAPAARNLT